METFQWIQTVFYALTSLGIYVSWRSFKRSQKIKRAEWITSLHQKFFEAENYKDARRWIDFEMAEDELSNDTDHKKEEKFADYLNFFEFIANLEKMKQLNIYEIQSMFRYYLLRINRTAICKAYIIKYQYKNLSNLLEKIKE